MPSQTAGGGGVVAALARILPRPGAAPSHLERRKRSAAQRSWLTFEATAIWGSTATSTWLFLWERERRVLKSNPLASPSSTANPAKTHLAEDVYYLTELIVQLHVHMPQRCRAHASRSMGQRSQSGRVVEGASCSKLQTCSQMQVIDMRDMGSGCSLKPLPVLEAPAPPFCRRRRPAAAALDAF